MKALTREERLQRAIRVGSQQAIKTRKSNGNSRNYPAGCVRVGVRWCNRAETNRQKTEHEQKNSTGAQNTNDLLQGQ